MYRKNVAGQNLGFALVNATTGAALTGATVTVKKVVDGAAQAAATGTVTEGGSGQYNLALSQADTNGNQISLLFTASGGIPVEKTIVTTAADPTNATNLGLGALPLASANSNGGLPILSSSGTTLAYTVSTISAYTGNTPQTGDAYARLGINGAGLTAVQLAAAGLDLIPVETGINVRQALSPILAAAGGVVSGLGTGTVTLKGGGVSTTRIVANTDTLGNRTSVTLTPPT